MTCIVSYIEWYKHGFNGMLVAFYEKFDKPNLIFLDSREILRTGTDPGDPYSYTLTNVDQYDTGLYSCVAGNILGETTETAYLLVNQASDYRSSSYWMVLTTFIWILGRQACESVFHDAFMLISLNHPYS